MAVGFSIQENRAIVGRKNSRRSTWPSTAHTILPEDLNVWGSLFDMYWPIRMMGTGVRQVLGCEHVAVIQTWKALGRFTAQVLYTSKGKAGGWKKLYRNYVRIRHILQIHQNSIDIDIIIWHIKIWKGHPQHHGCLTSGLTRNPGLSNRGSRCRRSWRTSCCGGGQAGAKRWIFGPRGPKVNRIKVHKIRMQIHHDLSCSFLTYFFMIYVGPLRTRGMIFQSKTPLRRMVVQVIGMKWSSFKLEGAGLS